MLLGEAFATAEHVFVQHRDESCCDFRAHVISMLRFNPN